MKPKMNVLGHAGGVNAVAFSPDGSVLLSAGTDGHVKTWDVETGHLIRSFDPPHQKTAASAVFSPYGKLAITGGGDGMVKAWNIDSGRNVRTYGLADGLDRPVFSLDVSADGNFIVTGESKGKIRLWDLLNQKELKLHTPHSSVVVAVAFLTGRYVVSTGADGRFTATDIVSGDSLCDFDGHKGMVSSFDVSADKKRIVSGGIDHTVRLWDVVDWKGFGVIGEQDGWVNYVTMGPVTETVASASTEGFIYIWTEDSYRKKPTQKFEAHDRWINCLAYSPQEEFLASGGGDGYVRIWEV